MFLFVWNSALDVKGMQWVKELVLRKIYLKWKGWSNWVRLRALWRRYINILDVIQISIFLLKMLFFNENKTRDNIRKTASNFRLGRSSSDFLRVIKSMGIGWAGHTNALDKWEIIIEYHLERGHAVAWLFEALCYKSKDHGFDSR
jgi:hypothetical protein